MVHTARRAVTASRTYKAIAGTGGAPAGRRHPLVAAAMVLPLAALLSVAFGGWEAVVVQASSVAGLLGR